MLSQCWFYITELTPLGIVAAALCSRSQSISEVEQMAKLGNTSQAERVKKSKNDNGYQLVELIHVLNI